MVASETKTELLPPWLRRVLTDGDRAKIAAAIHQAELNTSAEIVPMVVRSAGSYGHVSVVVGSIGITLLALLLLALNVSESASDASLVAASIAGGALILAASLVFSRQPWMRRALTSERDLAHQVWTRAVVEFHLAGLNATVASTGILLFVAVEERRAVVLADRSIAERLPAGTWADVCATMVRGLRAKDLGGGFAGAIASCGTLVAAHFPPRPDDRNELRDRLIVKE